MTAIFRTQCGCERKMQIAYPPQPTILLPLLSYWHSGIQHIGRQPNEPALNVRKFQRADPWVNAGPENSIAEYYEVRDGQA